MSEKRFVLCKKGDVEYIEDNCCVQLYGFDVLCECRIHGVTKGRKSCSNFKKRVTKSDLLKKICSLKKENEQLQQEKEKLIAKIDFLERVIDGDV